MDQVVNKGLNHELAGRIFASAQDPIGFTMAVQSGPCRATLRHLRVAESKLLVLRVERADMSLPLRFGGGAFPLADGLMNDILFQAIEQSVRDVADALPSESDGEDSFKRITNYLGRNWRPTFFGAYGSDALGIESNHFRFARFMSAAEESCHFLDERLDGVHPDNVRLMQESAKLFFTTTHPARE